jgi:hypothetical protein
MGAWCAIALLSESYHPVLGQVNINVYVMLHT